MCKKQELPGALLRARQRFALWRKSHRPRARFPKELWTEAVALASAHGHNPTARALGLDYTSLKKHIESAANFEIDACRTATPFVEVFPPARTECVIELEDGYGAKMRLSFHGGEALDSSSLIRDFWRGGA